MGWIIFSAAMGCFFAAMAYVIDHAADPGGNSGRRHTATERTGDD